MPYQVKTSVFVVYISNRYGDIFLSEHDDVFVTADSAGEKKHGIYFFVDFEKARQMRNIQSERLPNEHIMVGEIIINPVKIVM